MTLPREYRPNITFIFLLSPFFSAVQVTRSGTFRSQPTHPTPTSMAGVNASPVSWHQKKEKIRLPVAVRDSRTSVLKLPSYFPGYFPA